MKNQGNDQKKWKKWFYSLFFINIAIFLLITTLLLWPVSNKEHIPSNPVETDDSSEFVVRTTKKNLNELANAYIDKLLSDTNHHYQIILEEDVQLRGDLPVFSTTVPIIVDFDPIVQDNGDIILKQKSIALGRLQLPNKKIMEYMDKYLPKPKWVVMNPAAEEIYVAVTDMDIKSNFQVNVEQFDLQANHISFKIKVPYETLGIESIINDDENNK